MLFPQLAPTLSSPYILIPIPYKPNKLAFLTFSHWHAFQCTSHSLSRLFTSWIWKFSLSGVFGEMENDGGNYNRRQMVFRFGVLGIGVVSVSYVYNYTFMRIRWSLYIWTEITLISAFNQISHIMSELMKRLTDLIWGLELIIMIAHTRCKKKKKNPCGKRLFNVPHESIYIMCSFYLI